MQQDTKNSYCTSKFWSAWIYDKYNYCYILPGGKHPNKGGEEGIDYLGYDEMFAFAVEHFN